MKIALLGDIGLFGMNSTAAVPGAGERFAPMRDFLSNFDCVAGNLETPLTNAARTIGGKSAYIKGCPGDVKILQSIGVTHVCLANNHMYDYRREGAEETVRVLDDAGIAWYGLDGVAVEIGRGADAAVLRGYCCWSANGCGMAQDGGRGVNIFDPARLEKQIRADKASGRLSILSVHWGQEHVHYPNADHIRAARKLAGRCGGFILHGHHPHVLQGLEQHNGALIAYSLGNFCFDDVYTDKSARPLVRLTADNRQGAVLSVRTEHGALTGWEPTPFFMGKDGPAFTGAKDVSRLLGEWSEALNTPLDIYTMHRDELLQRYYQSRKRFRDFQWYVKRLNLESTKMLMRGRKNAREYAGTIRAYLEGPADGGAP